MPHLLDTDIAIAYLAGDLATEQLVASLAPSGIALRLISYMEVVQGILESANPVTARAGFDSFLVDVPVLPFSIAIADRCARLRMDLERTGRRVRSRALDLIIAATALELQMTLVTRNKADYADIPGLTLY